MSAPQSVSQRWVLLGAIAAMVVGMVLAWSQLAVQWGQGLPPQLAAKVGEQWLTKEELQRTINGVNSGRREALSPAQEQEVLTRLVNDLLLLQYGQDLGLVTSDPKVRKPLVQSVLGMIRANAKAEPVNDAEARDWFAQHQVLFQHEGKYQVRYFRVLNRAPQTDGDKVALANSHALRQQLLQQGSAGEAQLSSWQAERVSYLPTAPLPPNKLRDYLGQVLAEAVIELQGIGVTPPIAINSGYAVLQVLAFQPAGVPPYGEIKTQVVAEMQRQAGEQALASLLAELRADYEVQLADDWQIESSQ